MKWLACSLCAIMTACSGQPWRDPGNGPLLAVSRTTGGITLLQLDPEEREIDTIRPCRGPFGLAFAPHHDWLYATCWEDSKIALVNLRSHGEAKIFPGGRLPAWVQLRDGAGEVWISNEAAGKVTIYRSGTSAVLGEIATGAGPSDIVFTDSGRRAWVSNEKSGTVSLLDAETRRRIRDITVGNVPQGMALTSTADRLLVTNFGSNTVSVLDTGSAQERARIPVCQGPIDVAVSRRDGSELAYVACFGGGSVAVLDVDRQVEIQRIAVGDKPGGIAVHPDGGRVYVCVTGSNLLVVIATGKPGRIVRRMPMDGEPIQIAVVPGIGTVN